MVKLELTEEQVTTLMSELRGLAGKKKGFDLDLASGAAGEQLVASVLSKIEVKTDYIVSNTGNIVVEYQCRGKDSGISTTEAEWWAFVLEGGDYAGEIITLIKTSRLRKLIADCKTVKGGDDNASTMRLVPLTKLYGKVE